MTRTMDTPKPGVLDKVQRRTLMKVLNRVPWTLSQLEVTITRTDSMKPASVGSSGHKVSAVPFNQEASDARVALERALRQYALRVAVVTGRPAPHGPVLHAAYLAAHLPSIPDGASSIEGIYSAIVGASDKARRALDRPIDRVYLGACECGTHLYAREDADTVQCRVCLSSWSVAERREWMVEQARDRVGTPSVLARLMPWFDDRPINEATVRKWASRGKLRPVSGPPGAAMYRLGDVIDLHRGRGEPAAA